MPHTNSPYWCGSPVWRQEAQVQESISAIDGRPLFIFCLSDICVRQCVEWRRMHVCVQTVCACHPSLLRGEQAADGCCHGNMGNASQRLWKCCIGVLGCKQVPIAASYPVTRSHQHIGPNVHVCASVCLHVRMREPLRILLISAGYLPVCVFWW